MSSAVPGSSGTERNLLLRGPVFAILLLFCMLNLRAQETCARCHPAEVSSFAQSAMGRSVGKPIGAHDGRIVHKLSSSVITIRGSGSQLEHRVNRNGVIADYPIAYSVGAGIVGYSYFIQLGQYLFQSPASYYTQTKSWDLTPGYETERSVDFTHQINDGCLFCHTGSLNLVAGTTNQFGNPPFTPISCERCHGPSAAHAASPVAGSIVNPAKLSPSQRDSVCEQCHLEGETRVLNPGHKWSDFQAGQTTESVFATYLPGTRQDGSLRAVSQSELLGESQCARHSGGQLWCGSCHSPHADAQEPRKNVTQVCLGCHEGLFAAGTHRAATECVSCHMPRLRPTDVAHSAVTDHSIPRRPRPQSAAENRAKGDSTVIELKPWREVNGNIAQRDLGLAYFNLASTNRTAADLIRSYETLARLSPAERRDPPVESALASILLSQGRTDLAIELYSDALSQEPSNARYAYCLGTALEHAGKYDAAIKSLRRSIELDPSQPDTYVELSRLYTETRHDVESKEVLTEYLRFMPQNLTLRSSHRSPD